MRSFVIPVKRKHITQNRDIIKTNALAQLRIKELEDKVLALEAERTERELDLHRALARLERSEKTTQAIRRGWQLIGAGLAAFSSSMHTGSQALGTEQHGLSRQGLTDDEALRSLFGRNETHLRPSSRVSLDPNALPAGISRTVARPPEADLQDVAEEASAELTQTDATRDVDMGNETESEQGDYVGTDVSFAVEGEDTIRMSETAQTGQDTIGEPSTAATELERSRTLQVPCKPLRTPGQGGEASSLSQQPRQHKLQKTTSMDSLSSFGDEEEIQLSDDESGGESPDAFYRNRAVIPQSPLGEPNTTMESGGENAAPGYGTPHEKGERKVARLLCATQYKLNLLLERPLVRQGKSRTSSSDDSTSLHACDTTPSRHDSNASQSENESPNETRHSRRSSMRDRKSVNYALPKLNTKMRKPDPVDLVPAKGEKRRSTSVPMHDQFDAGTERGDHEAERSSRLKKGNGAASTGNLREIRKLHEQQTDSDSPGVSPLLIKDLVLASEQSSSEKQHAGVAANTDGGSDEKISASERGDAFSDSSETISAAPATSEPAISVTSTSLAQSTNLDERGPSPKGNEEGSSEARRPQTSTPVAILAPHSASTNMLGLSQDSTFSADPTAGTPIPKSTNRIGHGAGGIRPFKAAGRMDHLANADQSSAPARSPFVPANGQQSARSVQVSSAHVAGTGVSSSSKVKQAGFSHQRVLSGSSRANVPATLGSSAGRPVSANSGHTPPFDGKQRGSGLHAAMTTDERASSASGAKQALAVPPGRPGSAGVLGP